MWSGIWTIQIKTVLKGTCECSTLKENDKLSIYWNTNVQQWAAENIYGQYLHHGGIFQWSQILIPRERAVIFYCVAQVGNRRLFNDDLSISCLLNDKRILQMEQMQSVSLCVTPSICHGKGALDRSTLFAWLQAPWTQATSGWKAVCSCVHTMLCLSQ